MLIGITGKAGSGKDTVGEILRDQYDFAITSFAFPIKQIICQMLDVPLDKWNDREWRETVLPLYNVTPRRMAQTLGTEWGRNSIKASLWLDLAFKRIEEEALSMVAITDVRFRNEAEYIRAQGGSIIHVHRNGTDVSVEAAKHSSEIGIGNPHYLDFHINNFGTKAALEAQVDGVIEEIRRRLLKVDDEANEAARQEALREARARK